MVLVEKYDPVNVMMSVEKERCTAVYGVPTMYIAILDHPLFDKFDFSTLRTGLMSGSPCPVKRMQQCVDQMYMREVSIPYGLTETGPVMTQTRYFEPSLGASVRPSVRRCPASGRSSIETGELCAINERARSAAVATT